VALVNLPTIGTVLAAYISFGVSAPHLLAASVMSAPASLAVAKLLYPETEKSKTVADNMQNISIE
jgi:nucleoside permease NupC